MIAKDVLKKYNVSKAQLIEDTLRQDAKAQLSSKGSLVITTGEFTGRAINDKYVVVDEYTLAAIDWENKINQMDSKLFESIKSDLIKNFNDKKNPLYIMEQSVSADPQYSLGVKLITNSAAHALFGKTIFREKSLENPLGLFTIYHSPDFHIDSQKYNLHSKAVIAINFKTQEIIICGTAYCGEIKKSIFSVMNTLLPDRGVLPMHSGANIDPLGHTTLFFGLSGTGKTTLSTDEGLKLIGDDEHGLSATGIFNFEGGCYAKTYGLKEKNEPEIFKASNHFESLLENVILDFETKIPEFDNKSITENGRATYSLNTLDNVLLEAQGPIPSNIFFLSADALGVLPAISLLTKEQAMYYFLSGYTAKLAGTEIGLKGVSATFSHCFGAPFMMRKPNDYGNLLKTFLSQFPISVWLVNTGWFGGPFGEGKRYPLDFTRQCIRSILANGTHEIEFATDPVFNLAIPKSLKGVDSAMLNPSSLWKNQENYFEIAHDLKNKFDENFKKFL